MDFLCVQFQFTTKLDYLLFMKQWLRNCITYKHLIYYKVKDIFYIMF